MSKRAKKGKPVKLEVGQRWVFRNEGGMGWDDVVEEVTSAAVVSREVGDASDPLTWSHAEFRREHPRLRDPSELGPQTVTLPKPRASIGYHVTGTDLDARTAALVSELHDLTNELATVKGERDRAIEARNFDWTAKRAEILAEADPLIAALRSQQDSWRDVAERLDTEKAGLELQLVAAQEQYEVESHRWAVQSGEDREARRVLLRCVLAEMERSGGA